MTAEVLFEQVCEALKNKATKGNMFGAPCLKTPNGKAAICFYKDMLVFKPDAETLQEVLSWDRVSMFTPMGDRAMNGWAQMGMDYAQNWFEMAEKSVDFVGGLEAKPKKIKKR